MWFIVENSEYTVPIKVIYERVVHINYNNKDTEIAFNKYESVQDIIEKVVTDIVKHIKN